MNAIDVDAMDVIVVKDQRIRDLMAETAALRERCVEWLPFTEDAQSIQGSVLVWREDAGVFVAFYDDEQECWFTNYGEDLTGDLPTFYAAMPKGPTAIAPHRPLQRFDDQRTY